MSADVIPLTRGVSGQEKPVADLAVLRRRIRHCFTLIRKADLSVVLDEAFLEAERERGEIYSALDRAREIIRTEGLDQPDELFAPWYDRAEKLEEFIDENPASGVIGVAVKLRMLLDPLGLTSGTSGREIQSLRHCYDTISVCFSQCGPLGPRRRLVRSEEEEEARTAVVSEWEPPGAA